MSMPSDSTRPAAPGGFTGRYSDGRTAATGLAVVRIAATALEIAPPDGGEPVRWPYSSLRAAQPIQSHSRDVLLSTSIQDGATLFVDDEGFVRSLANVAPGLTARHIRLSHAMPWMIAAALAVLLVLTGWALNLSPAHAVARMLPDKARKALGRNTIESLTHDRKLCTAPGGVAALDHLTQRLVMGAPGKAPKFKVVVVDWGLLNAFATAGEQIVLTRGLITKAESPDEVAGVLAHEMGHGLEMHPETALVRALGLSAITELLLGGGGGTLSNIGLVLAQLSYSRAAEREADTHALEILHGARVSQRGLSDFFTRVEGSRKEKSLSKSIGDIGILRTHPVTEERKKVIDSSAPYASTPALDKSDWQALQAICSETSKF